jgi:predicted CoA-substrate-specific enzyme activase
MIAAGIDSGSTTTKVVLVGDDGQLLSQVVLPTGGDNRKTAEKAFGQAVTLAAVNQSKVEAIVATGYGRENIPLADRQVTEITCHATGMNVLFPQVRTILDIGGQDTKGIQIDGNGKVLDFVMNDKCAAGTGRFLAVMAHALEVQVDELAQLSQKSRSPVKISSMCTVFAESEVISLVAKGTPVFDIIKGVHDAVAERSLGLLRKLDHIEALAMSGGVAKNEGLVKSLEEKLKLKIKIPDFPQIVGAFGAATIARRTLQPV